MKKVCLALSCIVVMLLSGCSKETKISIGLIPKGSTQFYWKSIHAGAEKAAQELGVEVIWQGPQTEDDREKQINVVQNFISRGVDAIVLAPLDEIALVRPVKAAVKRNIPVVIIDSALKENIYKSFIATDNYESGRVAAKYLAGLLEENKKNVMLLRYTEGSASTGKREQGFLDGIKEFAPDVNLVSTDQYAGVTTESAMKISQNLLNKYSDLDGIFCPNELSTFGMLRALDTAGKAGKVKLIGYDASDPLIEGLKSKKIHGLVVQDPFRMGYLGIKVAYSVIKGEQIEPQIVTDVKMVTLENINDPDIVEVIAPDIKKWLGE